MKKTFFPFIALLSLALVWASPQAISSTASLLGVYTTDNVPALTLGYCDQFGGCNGGQLTFNGSTSGATILKPNAVAGSGTITLPTATGTLTSSANDLSVFAATTSAQLRGILSDESGTGVAIFGTSPTIGSPIITSPVISGPAPVACGATCTLGTTNLGTYTRLDTAAGSVATLPAATGTGNVYPLYISVATTSAADKILLTTVTDTIIGTAIGENAGTAKVFVGNASTYHSLQMPFTGSQPSGGFIGDTVVCTDVASTIWKCDVNYQAGTTPTTPYSASTT